MRITPWIKILIVACCVTLVGCHSMRKRQQDAAAISEANSAYQGTEAQARGLGQEASFGDDGTAAVPRNVSGRIYYFDFDSNVVHNSDRPAIYANAEYLISHRGARVMLEGHTDPRGSREYNIGLGERRARAVAELLTARGVSPAQIRVVSYGAEKLASYGHTEADFRRDRRVVLVYLKR